MGVVKTSQPWLIPEQRIDDQTRSSEQALELQVEKASGTFSIYTSSLLVDEMQMPCAYKMPFPGVIL